MVFQAIGLTSSDSIYENLHFIGLGNLILTLAGLIPGYFAALYLVDKWGRKPIQYLGFLALTILFIIMSAIYNTLGTRNPSHINHPFLALYCLANFFQNFGPNTTTFIIPGELFPTRYRSTAHGISTASGKLGAIIAQAAFTFGSRDSGSNSSCSTSSTSSNLGKLSVMFIFLDVFKHKTDQ